MTNRDKSVKICVNLGGGIMQTKEGTMAIEAVRKTMPYVNQEYRDKMISMGNRYIQKMHREQLKEYKEKLLDNLKKFQNLETITREELLASIDFVGEATSVVDSIDRYYADSRVRTVKSDIASIREIIDLYQGVYDLAREFEVFSNITSTRGNLNKAEEMVAYDRVQRSISQLQNHLMEKGILVPEIEEPSNNVVVTEEEVTKYKETLEKSLEMIQNLKDATVLDLLSMIQDYFEIEDKKDAFHSLYQYTEDMSVRMDILYIVDALESCEKVLPLASYFDKMNLDMRIDDYLVTTSSKEKEEIEREISKIQSAIAEKEDDFDETKPTDFNAVLEGVNKELELIKHESIDDVMTALEREGIIPVTEDSELKVESREELKPSFKEKRRLRREAKRNKRIHSKNLKLARKEYIQQIKNLQGQLNRNLKSGVTLMFVRQYRDNYYQDKLKTIGKRIERKYGSEIAKQLRKDTKIQMGRRRILIIMKELREGFEELLKVEIEKSDGTVTNLSTAENISQLQFQLMIETMPLLVDTVEENMKIVKTGGKAQKIGHNNNDLVIDCIEEEENENPLPMEEVSENLETEKVIQDEEIEYPQEKTTRALIRNSNYHYNTCKILLEIGKRNLRGEEFEQVCHRLSKELRAKRNLTKDTGKLWYIYKCSVEEVNNNIRRLRYASNIEVNDILENICRECKNFVTYFETYQERNQKSLKEKINDFRTSTLEDIREILSGEEYDDINEFGNNDIAFEGEESENPNYDFDLAFMNLSVINQNPTFERVEAQEIEYTPRDLKTLDVIPVVRNLSIHDEVVEQGPYRMDETAGQKPPIIVLGVKTEDNYTPLIDLATIEAQIRFLAQQENAREEEIYQKAI